MYLMAYLYPLSLLCSVFHIYTMINSFAELIFTNIRVAKKALYIVDLLLNHEKKFFYLYFRMSSPQKQSGAGKSKEMENPNSEKKALRPCCVCKETKMQRDECIILNGVESCGTLIEAHKKCLREHGFDM